MIECIYMDINEKKRLSCLNNDRQNPKSSHNRPTAWKRFLCSKSMQTIPFYSTCCKNKIPFNTQWWNCICKLWEMYLSDWNLLISPAPSRHKCNKVMQSNTCRLRWGPNVTGLSNPLLAGEVEVRIFACDQYCEGWSLLALFRPIKIMLQLKGE